MKPVSNRVGPAAGGSVSGPVVDRWMTSDRRTITARTDVNMAPNQGVTDMQPSVVFLSLVRFMINRTGPVPHLPCRPEPVGHARITLIIDKVHQTVTVPYLHR